MSNRILPLFLAMILLLAVALGSGGDVSAQSRPALGRDDVVIGTGSRPEILNPALAIRAIESVVLPTLFTIDVERDESWKPFPQGVEYLPSLADGTWGVEGERMTLLWKLRPRKWHDGRPVTCGDYVFSHALARNPEVPVADTRITNRIAGVECPKGAAGLDVRVIWKERFAHANLHVTQFGALPRHVLEGAYRRNPSRLREAAFGREVSATIGDGAYRLVEWRRGESPSVTVEAVRGHPIFGTPRVRRITWRTYVGQAQLADAMLSGEIDATSVVGIATADLGLQLERQAAGRFNVLFVPALIFEHIDFNLDSPLLQDLRVRRAIAHGINRTQIAQQIFAGRQPVAHSYLPTRHSGYTERLQRYPYDPARALALLKQAGFTPGPDGILRNPAGQRMSLELYTTVGNRAREQIVQIIQGQLAQVGIEVVIQNFPSRVLFDEIHPRRRFTMTMFSWVISPESDCAPFYTSPQIPNEANHWSGSNFSGYRNPEMDRLCSSASRELDSDMRRKLLQESTRLFARDLPALPLYFRVNIVAVKHGVQNYSQGGNYAFEAWNAHTWYWR